MKTELTLDEKEIKKAIEQYLIQQNYTVNKVYLISSPDYDFMGRDFGNIITCKTEVES